MISKPTSVIVAFSNCTLWVVTGVFSLKITVIASSWKIEFKQKAKGPFL